MRRRFFADAVEAGHATVTGAGAAHHSRVLRAQPGQVYELACENRVYEARVTACTAREVRFAIESELPPPPATPERIVAAALFKFDRFEWMLEKSTELGVTRILPLSLRRSDRHLVQSAPKRLERWRAIVKEAAQQSRRAGWPRIDPIETFAAFLAAPPEGRPVLLSELPGAAPLRPVDGPTVFLSGPEGGFAPEEHRAAAAAGFAPASLGPRILRCETAILAALAITASAAH